MSQLLVRNIAASLVKALRSRAARNGRSAEAEHREILREVLLERPKQPSLVELLLAMPDVGEDSDFERRRDLPRRVKL
jgi:antitoxin FitA